MNYEQLSKSLETKLSPSEKEKLWEHYYYSNRSYVDKRIRLHRDHTAINPAVCINTQKDYEYYLGTFLYLREQLKKGINPKWLVSLHYQHPVEHIKSIKETDKPFGFGLEIILSNMISEYKEKFPLIDSHLGGWQVTPSCQFVKYQPNSYYSSIHCENDGKFKKYHNRLFAWMIYLNDIKEGGGTYFHHQNFTTKPVAGNLYIWPAGWTHMHVGVNAPYESKYIITGWVKYNK